MLRGLDLLLCAWLVVAAFAGVSEGEIATTQDLSETYEDTEIEGETLRDAGAGDRELGDVTVRIDGRWQEFRSGPARGEVAVGCTSGCSAAANSEPPGSNSPWTYTTQSCTRLEVVEGYWAGNAYYDVYNSRRYNFTTSVGDENDRTYTTDPDTAWTHPKFGKGSVKLQPGTHSIVIRTKWMNPRYGQDGGWFRIRTVDCIDRCLARGVDCTTGTCCSGLICRRKPGTPSTSPKKCLKCAQQGKRCIQNSDCCNGSCLYDAVGVLRCFRQT